MSLLKPKQNNKKIIFIFFILAVMLIMFQNCGRGFVVSQAVLRSVQLNQGCLGSESSACLVFKNLVTQSGILEPQWSQMWQEQKYSVNLLDMLTETSLMNESFVTYSKLTNSTLQMSPEFGWKYRIDSPEGAAQVGQIMSFYWANYAARNSISRFGLFYAYNQDIKIVTDDQFYGWAPEKNQIHLSGESGRGPMSLDASLTVYYLGLANLDYANDYAIHRYATSNHRECGQSSESVCCLSSQGCSKAIASGVAEYLVAMTFPEDPSFANGWAWNPNGHTTCAPTQSRNVESFLSLTAQQAFDLCGVSSEAGEIYVMGTLYASIFWNMRKLSPGKEADIDRLYMLHLAQLNGDDTFVTAKAKLLSISQAQFQGQLTNLINQEFARRGL